MRKLVYVDRGEYKPRVSIGMRNPNWELNCIMPFKGDLDYERSQFQKEGQFFLVDSRELEEAVRTLAEANPGANVEVYSLESVAICPAAPMVMKKVTEDGILPTN